MIADTFDQLLAEQAYPCRHDPSLVDPTPHRAFEVEQIAVEPALVSQLSQQPGIVRRERMRGVPSLRSRQAAEDKAQTVLFAGAFEDTGISQRKSAGGKSWSSQSSEHLDTASMSRISPSRRRYRYPMMSKADLSH
jgi:hypothetical protein